jgi:hypothetical protein
MSEQQRDRRKLPYDAFTECWYVPGETAIVDLIHPDDGLTLHLFEAMAQIRARHPTAERMSCEAAWAAADAIGTTRYRQDIVEVTAERFDDALNVLPPVGWTTRQGVESFRISERIWGAITDIYARRGDRYFKLADDIRLSPDIIAERVRAFAAANPKFADVPARPDEDAGRPVVQAVAPKPGETS